MRIFINKFSPGCLSASGAKLFLPIQIRQPLLVGSPTITHKFANLYL